MPPAIAVTGASGRVGGGLPVGLSGPGPPFGCLGGIPGGCPRWRGPNWEVTGWVSSYEAIAAGEMATVSDAVPRLTGHPAKTFAGYLMENPDSYGHLLP